MVHRYHTEVAKEYGLPEAVMFYHIAYWVRQNQLNRINMHHGRFWTYASVKKMAETTHDYLTENQIRRALNHLIDEDVIMTGNFNRTAYDRTLWYTLTDKGLGILKKIEMDY